MTEDERAIRELIQTWMDASRSNDVDTVLRLMTDDMVFMAPGREPFGKDEFKAQAEALKGGEMDGHAELREIRILGDWAWVRNRIAVTMTPLGGGEPVHRSGYTLSILTKGPDGRWRLTRDANLVT